jgi:hypothetical protein
MTSGGETPPMKIPTDIPWDVSKHVLSLGSFPGTCILRNHGRNSHGRGTCSCTPGETHRDFFGFCRQIVSSSLRKGEDIPKIKVCWNAEDLFNCKLNRELTGRKDRPYFKDLTTILEANNVLFKGTYWYPRLIKGKSGNPGRNGVAILRLLANLPSQTGKESIAELYKLRIHHGSVNKLRSILATVDGLLMQIVLSFPDRGRYLNWDTLDQIASCMICNLTPDYFREKDHDQSWTPAYTKVKKLRKAIKEKGFNPIGDISEIDVPREMSFFKTILSFVNKGKRPLDMVRVATLCQTRAAGVPPRSIYFSTLAEIKEVLQEPRDPSIYERVADFIRPSVVSVHRKVLDRLGSQSQTERFWTNCLEKAKISLSDSGEFFTNSESGGKLEAARKVLSEMKVVSMYNLHTGNIDRVVPIDNISPGEALFHWALERFSDRDHCYERNLMSVRISLVAELGKYRAITVSHLAHAVLLHVLSHVLLEYLKAVPSSESGVGAANHAWNFFKRLSHKNPNASFIFGNKDVYLFSTDWEQATNYCDQTVAQSVLNNLCTVLGIPKWYRETCVFALCAPRQVEFVDPENKTLEKFYTTRGELMGDPVVKVILHYYHLVARETALMQLDKIKILLKAKEPQMEEVTPI